MKNRNEPAMPYTVKRDENALAQAMGAGLQGPSEFNYFGLTKREHFAGLAMQALAGSTEYVDASWKVIAMESVKASDALLEALEANDEK